MSEKKLSLKIIENSWIEKKCWKRKDIHYFLKEQFETGNKWNDFAETKH